MSSNSIKNTSSRKPFFGRIKRKALLTLSTTFKNVFSLFRSVEPVSRKFGFDRGGPIDHYYIERFIQAHASDIAGTVLEVAESRYSKKFGTKVERFEILHISPDNEKATLVADLTKPETLPEGLADCFICTQTFNFIYDFKKAIQGAHRLLKPGGVLLASVAGVSQISRYDMDRWGDYWRFTTLSCEKMFAEVFGPENVVVESWGNCLVARSFLEGRSPNELTKRELAYRDPDYQMLITVRAVKKA